MSWWEFWKRKGAKPDFVQSFLESNESGIPSLRSINQLAFTVLDTETTGLDTSKDAILSFGALKIEQEKILVNQSVEWYPHAESHGKNTVAIHELVEIPNKLSQEEFARQLLAYIGNSILVGHHIGFDLEMLLAYLKPLGFTRFPNPVIDTFSFAIRLEVGPQADLSRIKKEDYSLDALCMRYEIELDDRHTAPGDALLTALLFLKLLKKGKKKGFKNFKDLMKNF